jgi:hypothetical protein
VVLELLCRVIAVVGLTTQALLAMLLVLAAVVVLVD